MAKYYLVYILCLMLITIKISKASDPDPLLDFKSSSTDSSNFVLRDVFKNGEVTNGPGGFRAALNTNIFPVMESQGLTYVHFRMKPCGINLPHTHPRATEMLTMVQGGPIQAGFVDTAGKAHINLLYPGDVTIFPRGMLHFEINVGTEPAFYISALNSQNPGTLVGGGALFNLPARTLASSLNQDFAVVSKIKETMYTYGYGSHLQLAPQGTCTPGRDITTAF